MLNIVFQLNYSYSYILSFIELRLFESLIHSKDNIYIGFYQEGKNKTKNTLKDTIMQLLFSVLEITKYIFSLVSETI